MMALRKSPAEFARDYVENRHCETPPHLVGLLVYTAAVGDGYSLAEAAEARHTASQLQAERVRDAEAHRVAHAVNHKPTVLERDALRAVAELIREQEVTGR